MDYKFEMSNDDISILATIFNCTEEDIIGEVTSAYNIDRKENPNRFDEWSNMSFDVAPPTYIDEDYDNYFTFGICYEFDLNTTSVTLQTILPSILSRYGSACEQHFNADLFKDFKGCLWAIYEDAEDEQCYGSYYIRVSNNSNITTYEVSADDFRQMLDCLEGDEPIKDKITGFMNAIKERGIITKEEPNEFGSAWDEYEEDEQEIE